MKCSSYQLQICERGAVTHDVSCTAEQRWPEPLLQAPTPLLFQNIWIRVWVRLFFKFENPTLVQTPTKIIDPLHKKWPHRLLLMPKWKSDSGSGRKMQNPAGVDSGTTSVAKHKSTIMASHQSTIRLSTTWCQITFASCEG